MIFLICNPNCIVLLSMAVVESSKLRQVLSEWLSSRKPKTLGDLIEAFKEKGFAVLFLLLMIFPAMPLPTGGVTHIFELIVMLLSIELVAGKDTVWLPKSWLNKELPASLRTSALPKLISLTKFIEKHTKPRLAKLQSSKLGGRITGLVVLLFSIFAFLAPPFSGLDTLPSLGVVLIALALIFEDALLSLIGLLAGGIGIGLVIILGKVAFQLL